jgi:hypothetical protein
MMASLQSPNKSVAQAMRKSGTLGMDHRLLDWLPSGDARAHRLQAVPAHAKTRTFLVRDGRLILNDTSVIRTYGVRR